jgi:5-methylcytosine-specific restriction endonuclease McrA
MVSISPGAVPNPQNRELLEAQNGLCFYCLEPMRSRGTRDHLWPRLMGKGTPLTFNKVIACAKCNQAKADRKPTPAEVERYRDLYARCGVPRFAIR